MTGARPSTWLLAAVLPVVVCGAARGADAPEARIERLISLARSASRDSDAKARLAEAEKLLKQAGRSIDLVTSSFLRADILRARGTLAVQAFQRDRTKGGLRDAAWKDLSQAVAEYEKLVQLCEKRLDGLEERLGGIDPTENKQWQELRGNISRANYSEAWSHYNLALIAEADVRRTEALTRAIERFSGFTADGYRKHPIVADCFLGQALCYFEMKQYFRVLELLKPATAENTPAGTFKRMTYLLIKAGQAYGSHLAAENSAKRYFDALPASHKLDSVELGMALERAKGLAVLADPNQNPEYHKLFRGRLDTVSRTIYACGQPWRGELARILGTSGGSTPFKCLSRTRALFKAGKYAEAAAEARAGLAMAAANSDTAVLADLRYALAAAEVNQGEHLAAFRAAAEFIRHHPTDRRAAGLSRTALLCGAAALDAEGKGRLPADEFLAYLDLFEKHFRTRPEMKELPWRRASVLLGAGRYAEAEKALAPVDANSPVYLLAQYGLAVAAAKQAEALTATDKADPNAMAALLGRSAGAVGRFADAAAGKALSANERRAARTVAEIATTTAGRLLDLPAPKPKAALALLDRAEKLPPPPHPARRTAIRARAHAMSGDAAEAARQVASLLSAPGAIDGEAARTFWLLAGPMAAEVDRLVKAGEKQAAGEIGEKIVRMQTALLRHISESSDPAVRKQETAARLALAETLGKLGRCGEAVKQYEWLVENTPRQQAGGAIRGLAICHERLRQYGSAVRQWRGLADGLKKASDGWYEARYHWIWCLYQQGRREQARKLLAYFRLQHPKIASPKWRAAFDALGKAVGPPTPVSGPAAPGN